MDASFLSLNPQQRQAVEHGLGPLLVVAGAGSGKTRVLTARVASLLRQGIPPENVLAFTFTNRAAQEMRSRIEAAVGEPARRLWLGTFHATALRILRREAHAADLPKDFVIYDREDQEDLLREVVRRLELPESQYRLGMLSGRIGDAKNALVSPAQVEAAAVTPIERNVAQAYTLYQSLLRAHSALDFDDLIAETVGLFRSRPEVGERYARKFEHVLVDEYQDTNHAQFRLVAALGSMHGNVFVVGDEDQSIYGWRGADLANLLEFEQAFPGARLVRLEQNYRSYARILRAANAVIRHNRSRMDKTLWCERDEGPPLRFALCADENEEAARVAGWLVERRDSGVALGECAVLYRTNAQSRALEVALRQRGVPYRVIGGVSFYQRREVKDLLAYLRLAVNPADDVSFWRVWNTPRRGLGAGVRARMQQAAESGGPALEALRRLALEGELQRAARSGAVAFLALIDELRARAAEPVNTLLELVLRETDYLEFLDDAPEGDPVDRRGNVEELIHAAAQFASEQPQVEAGAFLAECALLTDADRLADEAHSCLLMTAHNAKGLEFRCVIVCGLEEGVFPHASSLLEPAELEEERRLFYVALTRAKDEVLLTAAAYRRRFDGAGGGGVSRFVGEIPEAMIACEEWTPPLAAGRPRVFRRGGETAPAVVHRTSGALSRVVGREVYHESFGRGRIVAAEEHGGDLKYTVRFAGNQLRKVLGRFLEVTPDGDSA